MYFSLECLFILLSTAFLYVTIVQQYGKMAYGISVIMLLWWWSATVMAYYSDSWGLGLLGLGLELQLELVLLTLFLWLVALH